MKLYYDLTIIIIAYYGLCSLLFLSLPKQRYSFNLHMSERMLKEQQRIKRDFHSNEKRNKKNILQY